VIEKWISACVGFIPYFSSSLRALPPAMVTRSGQKIWRALRAGSLSLTCSPLKMSPGHFKSVRSLGQNQFFNHDVYIKPVMAE
jgi:hypothetical protein